MTSIPIYLQQLRVENIKTFAGHAELHFANADGVLPQWTLILGDNGIGKSTILQLIAWMKPTLPSSGKSIGEKAQPLITNEDNDILERLVHKGVEREAIALVEAKFIAGRQLKERNRGRPSSCVTSIKIETNDNYQLKVVTPAVKASRRGLFYREDVVIYAYSASRHLGKQNLSDKSLVDTIPNFIQEKTELYDAEEVMYSLDYESLKGPEADREKCKQFLERLKQMLASVLPDIESSDDIDVTPPRILDFNREGGVVITTKYGKRVPFSDFSLGYRTIASWTIDLAWRLFTKHHANSAAPIEESGHANPADPMQEPGIVLIDELDLHMHPVWQREVMSSLGSSFPHMQFIVTAHSPLMVQAASDIGANIVLLEWDNDKVLVRSDLPSVEGWRLDQVMTSEFYKQQTARSPKTEDWLQRRIALTEREETLTLDEQAELRSLNARAYAQPVGSTSQERKEQDILRELARRLGMPNPLL